MKPMNLQSRLPATATILVLGVALIAGLGFSRIAKAWLNPGAKAAVTSAALSTVEPHTLKAANISRASPEQPAKERIGSEVITISRFGFETKKLTRPAEKFFLLIENRSGINPITFSLKTERGEKIVEVTQSLDQLDWAGEIDPRPGHYRLTIAERPAWVCDITITRP